MNPRKRQTGPAFRVAGDGSLLDGNLLDSNFDGQSQAATLND